MKKKLFSIPLIIAVILSLAAVSCGAATTSPGTEPGSGNAGVVNVYNWGEYIDDSIFADFTKETGIKVNYTTFASNEEMYSKLKLGGSSYDVIIPSDYMIARLIDEGMLEKLDFSNIPNYSLIDAKYKNLAYDPTDEYSVAYMTGTVGIIYNTKTITDNIDSWSALFDPKYTGQILMFDNPRDAFGIALTYLGFDPNTTNTDEINQAFELLRQQKPLLQAYVMDQIFDKLESGEAAIGPYYAGDYLTMRENNPDLKFVLPKEGSNWFVDAMCVPKGAANKKNAELFINFMSSTDAALKNMDVTGYVSASAEAAKQYGATLSPEDYAIMFPDDETRARLFVYANLPAEILTLYDQLWVQLKS